MDPIKETCINGDYIYDNSGCCFVLFYCFSNCSIIYVATTSICFL